MNPIIYIPAICIFLLILLFILYRRKNYYPYAARHLLTKREYRFYLLLKEAADEYHYIICPKVGVKDLLAVTDKKQYMKYFHKIAQKHVDFVICDKDLYVLFAGGPRGPQGVHARRGR